MEAKRKGSRKSRAGHNLCCHYCRISAKRQRSAGIGYIACSSCRMSYCYFCLKKHLKVDVESLDEQEWQCLCCHDRCCCQFNTCLKSHKHCFTYRRTQQRHAQVSHLKWTKKKRPLLIEDGEESCRGRPCKKRRVCKKKCVDESESSSSSSEESSSEESRSESVQLKYESDSRCYPRRSRKHIISPELLRRYEGRSSSSSSSSASSSSSFSESESTSSDCDTVIWEEPETTLCCIPPCGKASLVSRRVKKEPKQAVPHSVPVPAPTPAPTPASKGPQSARLLGKNGRPLRKCKVQPSPMKPKSSKNRRNPKTKRKSPTKTTNKKSSSLLDLTDDAAGSLDLSAITGGDNDASSTGKEEVAPEDTNSSAVVALDSTSTNPASTPDSTSALVPTSTNPASTPDSTSALVPTSTTAADPPTPAKRRRAPAKPKGPPVVAISDISRTYLDTLKLQSKTQRGVSLTTICKQLNLSFAGRKEKIIERILFAVARISTYNTSVSESEVTGRRVSLSFRQLITSKMQDNQTKTAVLPTGRSPSALSSLFSSSYLPVVPEPPKKTLSKKRGSKKRRTGPKRAKKASPKQPAPKSLLDAIRENAPPSPPLVDPKADVLPEDRLTTEAPSDVGDFPVDVPAEDLRLDDLSELVSNEVENWGLKLLCVGTSTQNQVPTHSLAPLIELKDKTDESTPTMDNSNDTILCSSEETFPLSITPFISEEATVSRNLCDGFQKLSLLPAEDTDVEMRLTNSTELPSNTPDGENAEVAVDLIVDPSRMDCRSTSPATDPVFGMSLDSQLAPARLSDLPRLPSFRSLFQTSQSGSPLSRLSPSNDLL